jgi:hypothetical protein
VKLLGDIATIWGICLGIGAAFDVWIQPYVGLRIQSLLYATWLWLDDHPVPDLPRATATATLNTIRRATRGFSSAEADGTGAFRLDAWLSASSMIVAIPISFLLTTGAVIGAELVSWKLAFPRSAPSVMTLLQNWISIPIDSVDLLVVNLGFDVLTVLSMIFALTIVATRKFQWASVALGLNIVVASILAFLCCHVMLMTAGPDWHFPLATSLEFFVEGWTSLFGHGRVGFPVVVAFYSSTTLAPVVVYTSALALTFLAKCSAASARYVAEIVVERIIDFPRPTPVSGRPEQVPTGTMLATLVAAVASLVLILLRILL